MSTSEDNQGQDAIGDPQGEVHLSSSNTNSVQKGYPPQTEPKENQAHGKGSCHQGSHKGQRKIHCKSLSELASGGGLAPRILGLPGKGLQLNWGLG